MPSAPARLEGLTLHDVILLKVSLTWPEAVAIVLGVLDDVQDRDHVPRPDRVVLTETGEIRATGGSAAAGHPVQVAATLLEDLIGTTDAPAELRTVLTQYAAPQPRHRTLDEFAAALAYFERPGRRSDVAAVYARTHGLYAKALADLELERLRKRAVQSGSVVAPPLEAAAWQHQASRFAVVALPVAVIAVAALALLSLTFSPGGVGEDVPLPFRPASAMPTPPVTVEEPAAVIDGDGATALMSGAIPPPAPTGTTDASAPRRPDRPARRIPTADSAPPAPALPAPVQWTVSVRDVTSRMVSTSRADWAYRAPGSDPAAKADKEDRPDGADGGSMSAREGAEALPLFTADDDSVVPASLVRPQLPSRLAESEPHADASILDVIVDERGRVERVILESPHGRVGEKMLVSAAKAWLFQPALRNGRPVRFHMRIRISD
ncbi:MAG: hypothetical protein AB7N65_07565 [Vicinamibacterales bacterium]